MNNFVYPIYKSSTVNACRNTFGQFAKDLLEKKGDFDFCLREKNWQIHSRTYHRRKNTQCPSYDCHLPASRPAQNDCN